MTTYANDRELRTATHKRDGEPVSVYEIRFTDPSAFCDDLKADAALGAIEDNIVRLAVVNQAATLDQVMGKWQPGGNRILDAYRTKYVEASYLARKQLVKLSCFCGVSVADPTITTLTDHARKLTEATALNIQSAVRKVQATLAPLRDIEVRGGGFYVQDGPWTAWPESPIEAPDELVCATCGEGIYWSNDAWRHESTRRAEAWIDDGMDGRRPRKKLDHLADPEEAGRQL